MLGRDLSGGDLRGIKSYSTYRCRRKGSGKNTVFVDIGSSGPQKAYGCAELNLTRRGVILDELIPSAELCVSAIVQKECLISVLETTDPIDRFGGQRAGCGAPFAIASFVSNSFTAVVS